MSHFTTIQTQIRDLDARHDACVEMDLKFLPNTKCRGYAGVTRLVSNFIIFHFWKLRRRRVGFPVRLFCVPTAPSNIVDSFFLLLHSFAMSTVAEQKKTPVGKIIGCGCLALVVIGLLAGGGIFFGVTKALKSNAPYRDAITAVESTPAAIAALGEPIKPGLIPSGNISINNGEGEVDFQIPVSGPNGKGTIHVIGRKPAGADAWVYDTRELRVEGQPDPIPLGK